MTYRIVALHPIFNNFDAVVGHSVHPLPNVYETAALAHRLAYHFAAQDEQFGGDVYFEVRDHNGRRVLPKSYPFNTEIPF